MASNKSPFYLIYYYLIKQRFLKGNKYIAGIDITNKCNLKCRYCYHKEKLDYKDNIGLSKWKKRFKKYYKMGIRQVGLIGGEPTLRYDIMKLAEDYFPYVFVFTNGQKKIPEEFNRRIILSIDGLKESHDWNRGKGTYDKAVKNYLNDKRVIVHCVLSKKNFKDVKDLINNVRKMNVQGIMFSFYTPKIGEDNSLVLSSYQKTEVKNVLFKELKRKDSILYMTKDEINFLVNGNFLKKCGIKEKIYCVSNDDKRKYCVTESADCKRCGCLYGCLAVPPFWKILPAFRHKKLVYDRFFKLD